ncbi:SH3 domain protein-like protein [Diplonema papillatum]|nr:SH3 domain protein-like protein [Diplonema papillatum]
MAAQYYRVLYDFQSVDPVELTVDKDILVVAQGEQDDASGWVQVETMGPEKRVGYVPEGYLEKVSQDEVHASARQPADRPSEPHNSSTPSMPAAADRQHEAAHAAATEPLADTVAQRRDHPAADAAGASQPRPQHNSNVNDPANQHDSSVLTHHTHGRSSPDAHHIASADSLHSGAGAGTGRGTPSFNPYSAGSLKTREPSAQSHTGSLVESFMKNEVYFRSLMKQRQETFMKLDACVADTATEVAACKAKNNSLAKKIRELENMIEEDRAKWRGRIEEEKRLLLSQTSTNISLLNQSQDVSTY